MVSGCSNIPLKMKVPILPLTIAIALLGAAVYFLSSAKGPPRAHFGAPTLTRIGDFDGTESEVAIAPDGTHYAAIVSGSVWLLNIGDGSKKQITESPDTASYPSWTPDSRRLTFTRGSDTWAVNTVEPQPAPAMLKENATSLSWSPTGRMAFVRDRELWVANSNGLNESRIIQADPDPDITIHSPRFSPDSVQISFIKSLQTLKGEVWIVNALTGEKRALVADRPSENPMDTGWIMDGKQLVYLTDRSGAYALWTINFAENTLLTLTVTLDAMPLGRIGMAVWKDRIVLPRHFVHSDIIMSDGTPVVHSDDLKFEPAVSPDGKQLAYTVQSDNKFTIWTCGIRGENPTLRTAGREPRWAANGYQLVFTHTDLTGNPDIWKLDLRNNETESVTDADEIDNQADWLPKGKSIAFASNHNGTMAIWNVPANGGPRVQLNNNGYFPRYTADGRSIIFWSKQAIWKMDANGNDPRLLRNEIREPVPAVLTKTGPKYYRDAEVSGGKLIWPQFDVLQDGRYVVAPLDIRESALWAVDLTFADK
jgi:Tol biopolymer transport system component